MTPESETDATELRRLDDPAVRNRCVKLKWQSHAQILYIILTVIVLGLALIWLKMGYWGWDSRAGHRRHHAADPDYIPWGKATLRVFLVMLPFAFCFRDYYLFDPLEQRLYSHFQFLCWRRNRILFRQGEILGISVDGHMQDTKWTHYWEYQLVFVGTDGRLEPIGGWRRDLDQVNTKASELANQLGCRSFPGRPESHPIVDSDDGPPKLSHKTSVPHPSSATFNSVAFFVAIVIAVVAFAYMASR